MKYRTIKGEYELTETNDKVKISIEKLTAVREDGSTFMLCLKESWVADGFVDNFNRLYKTNIDPKNPPTSSTDTKEFGELMKFIWNAVFVAAPRLTK